MDLVEIITLTDTIIRGGLCVGKVIDLATNQKLVEIQEQYINRLYKNKDYPSCYESCDYLLSLLPKEKIAEKKSKAFCYRRQAVCLKQLGRLDEANEKADMAEQYSNKDDRVSIYHLKCLIHKEKGETEQAVKFINKCIKWYKLNNMHYELGMVYAIKGDLVKSESMLHESIVEYNKALEEGNYFDKDILIKEIDYAYERLVELYAYIGEQNMMKAYKVYSMIQTKEVRTTSHKTITDLYRKEV
jgi:tetratricopeptide (TPR) repeat protein